MVRLNKIAIGESNMPIHLLTSNEKDFPKGVNKCYIQKFTDGRFAVMTRGGDPCFYRVYTLEEMNAKFQEESA